MRSITFKLILSFLIVSLVSVALIAVLARWRISREFSSFVFDKNSSDLVASLTEYYAAEGSWDQVVTNSIPPDFLMSGHFPGTGPGIGPQVFTLTDNSGSVIVGGGGYHTGQVIAASELTNGTPIIVDGNTVGIVLVGQDAFAAQPMEVKFIRKTEDWLLYSALGAAAVALLLGVGLAYNITRPIHDLIKATQAISQGLLGQQVTVRSRDEMGKLAGAFNKMSTDLARSTQARRQMTADIAHELRTPLSLIIAQAEAVRDGVLPASRKNFEIIHEEADRLEKMVEELRILSLADAGALTMNLQRVLPQKLVKEVADMHMARMQKKQVSLVEETAPDLPELSIDPERMIQVLTNILDNALRHTPEGGRITLGTRQVDGMVEISVKDTGSGVPQEDIEKIFDRLYRVDASRQREDSRSGLGLAIAKSVVEMHQGRIWAESPAGEGLTVHIQLPPAEGN